MHHLRLLSYTHDGSNVIAIAFSAAEANLPPVIFVAAIVAVKIGGAIIRGHRNIQVAVMVEIAVGRAQASNAFESAGTA